MRFANKAKVSGRYTKKRQGPYIPLVAKMQGLGCGSGHEIMHAIESASLLSEKYKCRRQREVDIGKRANLQFFIHIDV